MWEISKKQLRKFGFDKSCPIYFDRTTSGGFHDFRFRHVSTRLTWFGQPKFKKEHLSSFYFYAGKTIGYIIDFIGNISHYFSSRFLCYWVGGFDEIEFIFEKNNYYHLSNERKKLGYFYQEMISK